MAVNNNLPAAAEPVVQELQEIKQDDKMLSLSSATFSLAKTAIGAGCLFLPAVFVQFGLVLGIILLVVGAITSGVSLYFLGRLSARAKSPDYIEIAKLSLGFKGELVTVTLFLLLTLAPLIVFINLTAKYTIAFISNVTEISKLGVFGESAFISCIIAGCILLPLCLFNDLRVLSKFSLLGLLFMLYIIGLTAVDLIVETKPLPPISSFSFSLEAIGSFSRFIFAFMSHTSMCFLTNGLYSPTPRRRAVMIITTNALCLVLYLIIGVCGYVHFGAGTPQDILDSGNSSSPAFLVAKISMAFVNILSYPLIFKPSRECLQWLMRGKLNNHLALTLMLLGTVTAISVLYPRSLDFFDLFGSFAGSSIQFVLPSLFFILLSKQASSSEKTRRIRIGDDDDDFIVESSAIMESSSTATTALLEKKTRRVFFHRSRFEMFMAILNICFGMLVCVLGTTGVISKMIRE